MSGAHHDWIRLEGVSFPCVLGIFGWEQSRSQLLEMEVALGLDLDAAAGGDLSCSVNYAEVLDRLMFIAQEGRWGLLESMASVLARHLLMPPAPGEARSALSRVRVRLRKPQVFQGRGIPTIEIARDAAWCRESLPAAGRVGEVLCQPLLVAGESGAYHLRLPAGSTWQSPRDMTLRVLAGQAVADGRMQMHFPRGGHRIHAMGDTDCTFLALSQPPLEGLETPWPA